MHDKQQRRMGGVTLWVAFSLVLVWAFFLILHVRRKALPPEPPERVDIDPAMLRELQGASLKPPEAPRALDWPQWRGPLRDGLSREPMLTTWPEQGPRVLWRKPAGAGYSCVAIAGRRLLTLEQDGADEVVVCRDSDTGDDLWRFRYPHHIDRDRDYKGDHGTGPRSTPTIDGDLVYTVGATGRFHCLKLATGDVVWKHDLLEEFKAPNLQWGTSFSPLVEGGLVLTNPGGPDGNSLAAFDRRTGKLVWKTADDPAGYSSPFAATIAGTRQVLFLTGTRLVSVAPATGEVYWSYPWATEEGCNIATPIVVGDYCFISAAYGQGCALLKVLPRPAGGLEVKKVYENTRMRNHFSTCVYHEDHLYGFNEAMLTCMNFRTGEVAWTRRGYGKGALLLAEGHLVVLGDNGKLALAEATPRTFHTKASVRVFKDRCWTVPVLVGGRLYLRGARELVCLDVKK